jgi:cytoskeletal protein RodZ
VAFPLVERLRAMTRTPGGVTASVLAAVLLFGGLAWAVWPGGDATQKAPVVAAADKAAPQREKDGHRLVASTASVQEEPLKDDAPAGDSAGPAAKTAAKAADPIGALIASTMGEDAPAETGAQESAKTADAASHANAEKTMARLAQPGPRLHENAIRPVKAVPESGLALRAAEQIFLRLEDDAGKTWFSGFLNPGEVLALPQETRLRLTAGDAHRLEWFANGQKMGRLARQGADFLSEPLDRFYQQAGLAPRQARRGG